MLVRIVHACCALALALPSANSAMAHEESGESAVELPPLPDMPALPADPAAAADRARAGATVSSPAGVKAGTSHVAAAADSAVGTTPTTAFPGTAHDESCSCQVDPAGKHPRRRGHLHHRHHGHGHGHDGETVTARADGVGDRSLRHRRDDRDVGHDQALAEARSLAKAERGEAQRDAARRLQDELRDRRREERGKDRDRDDGGKERDRPVVGIGGGGGDDDRDDGRRRD